MYSKDERDTLEDTIVGGALMLLCWPTELCLGLFAVDILLIPFAGGLKITAGIIIGLFYFIKYILAPVILMATCADIFLYFYKREDSRMTLFVAANIVSLAYVFFGLWLIQEGRIEELNKDIEEAKKSYQVEIKNSKDKIYSEWNKDRHKYMTDARDMLYYEISEMSMENKKCKVVLKDIDE